jgi:beta-lactamase class A
VKRARFLAGAAALAAVPRLASAATLEAQLHAIARRMPATVGVVALTMESETPIFAYNEQLSFPTASIIKLAIMLTAFNREAAAPGTLSEQVVTHRANLIGGSDFMATQPDGAKLSVLELIHPMITLSDNTASNALIGHFGVAAINAAAHRAGMTHTHLKRKFLDYSAIVHHQDNRSTPADMAHLLFAFERGAREGVPTVASSTACRAMIEIMLGQTDKEGIPDGVPGVPVANKTGAIDYTRNDVAIVDPFGNSPFVLAVMSERVRSYGGVYLGMRNLARTLQHHLAGSNA